MTKRSRFRTQASEYRQGTVQRNITENGTTLKQALDETKGIVRIPRMRFAPDSIMVDLIYSDTTLSYANNGATLASFRYSMNSIRTPLSGGSSNIPGYTNWGAFYSDYKVLRCAISIDFVNQEAFPMEVLVCPTTHDIGTNYAHIGELFANPYASQSTISSAGGLDRVTLEGSYDLGEFYGNTDSYLADLDYTGEMLVSNPAQQFYLNVGAAAKQNMSTAKGFFYRSALTYTVLLTGRKVLFQ